MKNKIYFRFIIILTMVLNSLFVLGKPRTLNVGYCDNPPFMLQDNKQQPGGIVIDIINDIAEKESWEIKWHFSPFGEMLQNVYKGVDDLAVGLVETDERKLSLNYCKEALFTSWGLILQYKDEDIKTLRDMEGKTLGLIKGAVYTDIMKKMLAAHGVNCFIQEVPMISLLIEQTKRGDINACLLERSVLYNLDTEGLIKSTEIVLDPMKHFAVSNRQVDNEVLERIDFHLSQMKSDYRSVYYKSFDRWLGNGLPAVAPQKKRVSSIYWSILGVLLLMIITLLIYSYLKSKKNKQQYELLNKESSETIAELRASDEGKANILNCIAEAVIFVRPDHSIGWINKAGIELFGVEPDKVIGRNCVHVEAGKFEYCNMCPVKACESAKHRVVGVNYFEALRKHLRIEASPMYDDDGELKGIVEVVSDVTLQHIKKEENNKNLDLFEKLFDLVPVGVMVVDSKQQIFKVNNHLVELLGYSSKDELIGKERSHILNVGDDNIVFRGLVNTGKDKKYETLETVYVGNKRQKVSVLKTRFPVILHTEQVYVDVLIDITSLNESREALKLAKEKAEESDVLKSAFLANMSHEIRNPLAAITGLSNLLEEDLSVEEKHDVIKLIQENTHQMLTLIDDIIDISQIQSGQLDVLITTIDIVKLSSKIYSDFSKTESVLSKKAVEFRFNPAEGVENLFILADETRLIQIINNFLTNAIKYIDEGYVEFGYQLIDNRLCFFVRDTGFGIAPEDMENIFKPYRLVERSSEQRYESTSLGLGLAISKQLAEMMNARIEVESEVGKGSTFWLKMQGDMIASE